MNQSFYIMLASATQTKAPQSALVLRVNTLCNSLEAGSGEFHKVAWSLTAFLPNARSCETAGTKRSSTQCMALPAASQSTEAWNRSHSIYRGTDGRLISALGSTNESESEKAY